MRRILSAVLALVMVVSLMGTAVFAAEGSEAEYVGTYTGSHSYTPAGMPMSIDYSYTLELKADGTYAFKTTYAVSGSSFDGLIDSGTYTVADGKLTLTVTACNVSAYVGKTITGTYDAGTVTMSRALSQSMSASGEGTAHDITLKNDGYTPDSGEAGEEGEGGSEEQDQPLASGTCGAQLTWVLDQNKVLTISGTGAMDDYNYGTTPWKDYQSAITAVVLEEGVTSIGQRAFMLATATTSIKAAASVTRVNNYGIYGCSALQELVLPGVTELGDYAVRGCTNLATVALGKSLKTIGSGAFYGCTGLKELVVPASVSQIGGFAFQNCTSLTKITFEGDAPNISGLGFKGVTADCYYPAGNATWTEKTMLDYGGTLTWNAVGNAGGDNGDNSDDKENGGAEEKPAPSVDYSAYAGAYHGTHTYQPGAMPMAIAYSFTMTLKADGSYTFVSSYKVAGADYEGLNETGTFAIDNGALTVTASNGTAWTGTISGDTISIKRPVGAAMSGEGYGTSFDVTMTKEGTTTDTPETDKGQLTGGKYAVDISWSPMASMIVPVLEIHADSMTFQLYNQPDPQTGKGAGSISYADGTYTMTYENGNTTTFTFADGVITFTSKLWYGAASFDQSDKNGKFISYTASPIQEGGTESDPQTVSGTYQGTHTYQPNGMPMSLKYSFTLELKKDGTYSFRCRYGTDDSMSADGLQDSGTYTLEDGKLTITTSDGTSWEGTLSADGSTIEMNRPLTPAMSGSGYGTAFDIVLKLVTDSKDDETNGDAGDQTPDATEPEETKPEETKPEETKPEETEPEETKPEQTELEATEPTKSTVISVSNLSELKPGTYKLTAQLDCYMTAMGGCQFGGALRSAYLIVDENGGASIKLSFRGDAVLSMMYGTTIFYVNPNGETSYWNGSQWVNASFTTATGKDEEGNAYTYVSSMTFPVSAVQSSYELGLGFGGGSMGAQFGGANAQMLSDGSVLKATLNIDWTKVYTNPVTGDETNMTPYVIVFVLAAGSAAALLVMKKRKAY